MRRLKNMVAVIMMAIAFIGVSSVCVYADSNPMVVIANTNQVSEYESMCSLINHSIWQKVQKWNEDSICFLICEIDKPSVKIEINMQEYNKLAQENKQKVMQIALSEVDNNTKIARIHRTKIYNEICALDETTSNLARQLGDDVQSDFGEGYAVFKPFSGVVGWIFGLITLLMFIIISITFVVDIAYINLPMFQNILTSDNKKPRFVSLEAWSAVMEADSKAGQEYLNPTMLYLGHKSKQFLAVAVCVLYLTSGKIFVIIAQVINYFRGISPAS